MEIYLDYAATTPVDRKVFKTMEPYFSEKYGNPSSIHSVGQEAKKAVDDARVKVAKALGASPEEIVFTSCATESNNLAIKGVAFDISSKFKVQSSKFHIITSAIEHHSVLHVLEYLEKFGFEVTYLPVGKNGIIKVEDIKKAIKDNTILVSIMYANNEIGTVQPISNIADVIAKSREQRAKSKKKLPLIFHTDAVQAIQYLDCDVNKLGVDFLSLTGHKFYAPKGVGGLYIRKGVDILPQQQGGGHERGLRSGTENVPSIVGLGEAIELVTADKRQETRRLLKLRDQLISSILKEIPEAFLSGDKYKRLPNNVNFCFKNVEGESLVLKLSKAGIAASTGSACTSASLEPSHVLLACGISPKLAHGSLRLTLGKWTKEKDIDYLLKVLPPIINDLRKMSPFN